MVCPLQKVGADKVLTTEVLSALCRHVAAQASRAIHMLTMPSGRGQDGSFHSPSQLLLRPSNKDSIFAISISLCREKPSHPANAETDTINVAIMERHKAEGEHAVKSCTVT